MTVPGYANDVLVDADWAKAHLDDPTVRFVEVDVDTTAYDQSHIPGAVGWNWTSQLADGIRRDIAVARGLQRSCSVRERHRRRTPRSSSTATTTTGSPRGPTGSSSCSATATSGSSTAAASSGSTTACRSRPTCRRTRRPATSCPSPTSRCAPSATTSCRASATRRLALVDVRSPGRVQRRDHRPAGHERDRPARRATSRAPPSHPVGPDGPRGRHVQGPRRARATCTRRKGITPDKDVIAYCRIGERSSHSWFVLHELLGYQRVRNYDGIWTEWGSMVGVPIEKPVAGRGGLTPPSRATSTPVLRGRRRHVPPSVPEAP